MSADVLDIIGVVEAVLLVREARSRVPADLKGYTFYGKDDEWLFLESGHKNMCADCASFHLEVFSGRDLRRVFPNHAILDADSIAANMHPHCSCLLIRVIKSGI